MRCQHVITWEEYRVTAVSPAYNLLLSVRQRRLRYLGHLLRLPLDSVVCRTIIAMAGGGNRYPEGSLFMDCQGLRCTIGPTGSIMNMMMMTQHSNSHVHEAWEIIFLIGYVISSVVNMTSEKYNVSDVSIFLKSKMKKYWVRNRLM